MVDDARDSQPAAIRNEGQRAEDRFLQIVSESRPSPQAKRGDAVVSVDGYQAFVEIKHCRASRHSKSATVNQVRAIKYICCVIWAPARNCWYVLSPDHLVHIAAGKSRGQHTEIPFESMAFSLDSLPDDTKCDDQGLTEMVVSAIRQGRMNTEIRDLMRRLHSDIRHVTDSYCNAARDLPHQSDT